jgi:hypothetical protein
VELTRQIREVWPASAAEMHSSIDAVFKGRKATRVFIKDDKYVTCTWDCPTFGRP